MSDDVIVEPPEPSRRIGISLEPEAAGMLDEMCRRLYPDMWTGKAQARIIEMAIRGRYHFLSERWCRAERDEGTT